MTYDCFTFFNELEILELRLQILNSVVDRFVLVESSTTFTGKPKSPIFWENRHLFSKYLHKIEYVWVTDSPEPTTPQDCWNVEHFQRNAIDRGLQNAKTSDQIIISDVDEIPHPEVVWKNAYSAKVLAFPQTLYYYYANCRQNQLWWGSVMAPRAANLTPQDQRTKRFSCKFPTSQRGWHFSYFGNVSAIQLKLAAFSETQVNTAEFSSHDHIQHCLETGTDLFLRKDRFAQKRFVTLDETYPTCIHDWLKKYPQFYHHA